MGTMEFGYNEHAKREFYPMYGELDWHQMWLDKHGEERMSVWGQTIDELGEFCEQIHQANCAFYLNETNPDFDVLVVIDHRDKGGDFWWSRYQMGNDQFEHLLDQICDEVTVVFTKYPMQQVAEFVLSRMEADIE